MRILVTGAAGFIGFHVSKKLINQGYSVVGLDNINDYYDINLKFDRLKELGIKRGDAEINNKLVTSTKEVSFNFVRLNLEDKVRLSELFEYQKFDVVCNLAAQAGVRYSIENPEAYLQSNVLGFLNVLECCKDFKIKHLIYASSSSVYGLNKSIPFKITDSVDHPISIYAATKKSNELMAHTYSHLYNLPTTGLRFFTVYGPWGRPDMAMFLFTKAILNGEPIKIFNRGKLKRDFTYVDDVVKGVVHVIEGNTTVRDNYLLLNLIPLLLH
ncbi:MAG: NAD-dependent epimerase/dehydratase family protein [Bacteroidota bacterium]